MKRILITGISGFAGSFLLEHLLSDGNSTITGTYHSDRSLDNIQAKENVRLVKVDLMDRQAVDSLIKESQPELLFHLAALASPAESFKNPVLTFNNNVIAQLNLFEALRVQNLSQARVLVVSSAEVYGVVASEDIPIDEETKLQPVSPYAVSKIAQDYLGLQYHLSYNFQTVRVRPFNHIGPRQSPFFVVASFAKKIAEIEKNNTEPIIKVGNLTGRRDFTDVRDMVRAYQLILEQGKTGEVYNIGSGKDYEIAEVLQILLSMAKVKIRTEEDQSLLRPIDNPKLLCNNQKMAALTGWKLTIPLEQSLRDTLDYWRETV